jgi:FkbM family methyltransferase
MKLDLSDWVQLVIYLFGDYKYEASEIRLWKKWVKQADRVLDIGAHVGYYSLLAKSSNPGLRIDVFEPSRRTYECLTGNISANGMNISTHYMALGNEEGTVTMNQPDPRNSGMNFISTNTVPGAEVVPLSTWDRQFPAGSGSEGRVIVKIDAEGAELRILEGGIGYIRSQKPVIFIELLNSTLQRFGADTGMVYDLMVPLGYAFYRLDENKRLQECAFGDEGEVLILIPEEKREVLIK